MKKTSVHPFDGGHRVEHDANETVKDTSNVHSRQYQLRMLNILLLILLLGLFLFGFNGVISYEGDIQRSTFTVNGTVPTPLLEMRPTHNPLPFVAIVAHGYGGSKDLMSSFGAELAHAGVTTYLLDFPGHGTSTVAMKQKEDATATVETNSDVIADVVHFVKQRYKTARQLKIILLGYAMGATAVEDYTSTHADDATLIATILISPTSTKPDQTTIPIQQQNVLLLVGQNDFTTALATGQHLLHSGCEATDAQKIAQECGVPKTGSGRRLTLVPNANHLTILNTNTTFHEILDWLHTTDPTIKANNVHADTRLFWLLLGAAAIMLALIPLCPLLVEILLIRAETRPFQFKQVLIGDLCLLVGIVAALLIQRRWQPFSLVSIAFTDYISGYCFIAASVATLLFFILRRRMPWPAFSQVARQILLGVILAAFLYLTLGQLMTFAWENLTFTWPRLWRFAVVFALLLPLFLLDEGLNYSGQENNRFRTLATSVIFKALVLGGLFVAIKVTMDLSFLELIFSLLALLFLMLVGTGMQLYNGGRAALAGAIFSALLLAWILSTTFPLTS